MSNLPAIAQLQFPPSKLTSPQTTQQMVHVTYDWDFDKGDFRYQDGKLVQLTGMAYLKVWMQKALRTVKDTLLYKGTSYGFEGYSLTGTDFDSSYTRAEYTRMVQETLLQNGAILSVTNFTFTQTRAQLTIGFTVNSIYGTTNANWGVPA